MVTGNGRVTVDTCSSDSTISSGDTPLAIDDHSVIALHTRHPLWRDISLGDSGQDVRALQEELKRLEYDVTPSGHADWPTIAAIQALRDDSGMSSGRTLGPHDVIWLPKPTVNIAECKAALGRTVSGDTAFATTVPLLQSVTVVDTQDSRVPHQHYALEIDDVQVRVPDDGVVDDADFLDALRSSQEYQRWQSQDDQTPLLLNYSLADPLTTYALPPTALFGLSDRHACVRDADHTYEVEIISSSLGQSLVTFDPDETPPRAVAVPADERSACP